MVDLEVFGFGAACSVVELGGALVAVAVEGLVAEVGGYVLEAGGVAPWHGGPFVRGWGADCQAGPFLVVRHDLLWKHRHCRN